MGGAERGAEAPPGTAGRIAGGLAGLASGWARESGPRTNEASLALSLAESILLRGFDPEDFGRRALARRGGREGGRDPLPWILPASAWLAGLPEPARFRALASYAAQLCPRGPSFLAVWLHCLVAARLIGGLSPAEAYAAAAAEARAALPALPEAARREAGAFSRILGGRLGELGRSELRGSGSAADCLEAALWCLLSTGDLASCLLAAAALGEEGGRTGAVAGGLAGLAYGRAALPGEWLASLARAGEIEELGPRLGELAASAVPLPGSYWILPGKLLAGPYPYCPNQEEGEARLASLLDAGIGAFVDLTEPGETLRGRPVPPYAAELSRLAAAQGRAVEALRVRIRDVSVPGPAALEEALGAIDRLLAGGSSVYLHCLGGIGRTGTIAGSWLARRGLAAPGGEALGLIAAYRAWPGAPASPETEEQRELVRAARPGPGAFET